MTVGEFKGGDFPYPEGAIVAWYDSIDEIPDGWAVCDGTDGTPDLMGRFIRSVPDNLSDPGTTGGADFNSLDVSQLPSHSHTGTTTTNGAHEHYFSGGGSYTPGYGADLNCGDRGRTSARTDPKGSHSHSAYTNYTGSGSEFDNRPAFTEVVFIQRIGH